MLRHMNRFAGVCCFFGMLLLLAGCGLAGQIRKETEPALPESIKENEAEMRETGSFEHMEVYKEDYALEVWCEATGHPSQGVDFETMLTWEDTEKTETDLLVAYNIITAGDERFSEEFSKAESVTIDNKTMYYETEEDTLWLFYEVDENAFLQITLTALHRFDMETEKGIDVEVNMRELVQSDALLDGIRFTISKEGV